MGRIALVAGILGGFSVTNVRADLPVAPPPREVRADGSREPVPEPQPAVAEDPSAIVARIIANSKDAGDRLGQTDTGTETQKKQAIVLKDIDTLLNQQNNPQGGGADDKDKEKDKDKKKDKDKEMNPHQKKDNAEPPKNDMPQTGKDMPPMKQEQQPMPGDDSRSARRPRQGRSDTKPEDKKSTKQDSGTQPKEGNSQAKNEPMKMPEGNGKAEPKDGKDEKNAKNAAPRGGVPKGKTGNNQPSLPLDEDVAKKVWGGPRDQLRKQVDQYYNERFMPGYSGLLKSYYSYLAEEGARR